MEMLTNYLDGCRANVNVLIVTTAMVLYRSKVVAKCEMYSLIYVKPINQYQQFQSSSDKISLESTEAGWCQVRKIFYLAAAT